VDVSEDTDRMQEMINRSGNRTVPQIFIDGDAIGGFQELALMNASGDL
jgi:glutaredoxin